MPYSSPSIRPFFTSHPPPFFPQPPAPHPSSMSRRDPSSHRAAEIWQFGAGNPLSAGQATLAVTERPPARPGGDVICRHSTNLLFSRLLRGRVTLHWARAQLSYHSAAGKRPSSRRPMSGSDTPFWVARARASMINLMGAQICEMSSDYAPLCGSVRLSRQTTVMILALRCTDIVIFLFGFLKDG